ncbi:uncharacterized protein LOC117642810 [Thrips palmi]|uniref:Uncharacterized protein LOC117642810 n=1 Tax=Thrips palmi TaxID=161013 RepID=A0A6P8YKJ8_THRPL|nr:uncharacterized protein LOC117642810 [Thrips palmi]XP_034237266.1 uncharacterized protein LOC117642810 [Thrips palmi]
MDADALARSLEGLLPSELIKNLKAQCIDQECFMGLTEQTLKLFDFPMGHIILIIKLIGRIEDGKQVLVDHSSTNNHQTPDKSTHDLHTGSADELDDGHDILRQHVSAKYLSTLTEYELSPLREICLRWKRMSDSGFPCTAKPYFPGVPLKELQQNAIVSGADNEPRPKRRTPVTHTTEGDTQRRSLRSERAQLMRPAESSDSDHSDLDDDANDIGQENLESAGARWGSRRYKVPALPHNQEALKAMSPSLPAYNVEEILLGDNISKKFVPDLKEGFLFEEKTRKLLFRVIVKGVCDKFTRENNPTKDIKEGIAKSITVAFPQFQKLINVPGKMPWSHIYGNNTGHVANIVKRLQSASNAKQPKSKKVQKKKQTSSTTCTIDIAALALVMPDRVHRMEILDGMSKSFELRQADRSKGLSITELITKYPHLLSYKGEVIAAEFKLMFPNAEDMPVKIQPLIPKVIEHFQDPKINPALKDDTLKAFMLMASSLPHSIRRKTIALPQEDDLVIRVKLGVDIASFVDERRADKKKAVQPYLIAVQGALSEDVLQFFLVLDSFPMELGRIPFIRGIDWVLKACCVFNVHYPASWNQFFRFCQTCLYKVFISGEDDVPPSSSQLYTRLMSL